MKKIIFTIICGLLVFAGCSADAGKTSVLDSFSTCLTDNGLTLYGTSWCPHCNDQKDMFGESVSKIDFVDCDVDSAACREAGVDGYPTWVGEKGERLVGTQPLNNLAKASGCELPEEPAESNGGDNKEDIGA